MLVVDINDDYTIEFLLTYKHNGASNSDRSSVLFGVASLYYSNLQWGNVELSANQLESKVLVGTSMAATDEAWQIVKRGEVITFTRSGNVVATLTADPSKYPQTMNFRGWSAFTELGMSNLFVEVVKREN